MAVVYVIAARLGFQFAFAAEQVTTVWAPTGIAQAALLLWGGSFAPAIWVGAFVVNAGTGAPLWTAVCVASGNTLEALTAVWCLRRLPGFDPALRRVSDAVAFTLVAAGISTAVSATIGVATLCAAGVQPWTRFAELWTAWWLGDAVGALVIAPLILTIASTPLAWWRLNGARTCFLLAATIVVTHVVFGSVFGSATGRHPLEFIVFPLVIAGAVRVGHPAAALVVACASAVAIWDTVRGAGPFAGLHVRDSLILLQAFTGVMAGTGLLLAAAMAEQKTSERRRAAAYAVSEVLANAHDLAQAAPAILRAICETLEWHIAALWLVHREGQHLQCVDVWSGIATPIPAFAAATRGTPFPSGVGLPGRVWASGTAVWIQDVSQDPNFPRAQVAREIGVQTAFAFPICLGDATLGVIECFNQSAVTLDTDLLRTMSTVGQQIGQFIERRRVEAAVEELLQRELSARREAETANRAKDEFLATLSHELRTPLNAILGWTRMLLDGTMDPRSTRRALEVIDRNARLQAQLVGDILDVSRIITGGLRLNVRPVDLSSVVGAALDAVRPAADAKQVRIRSRLTATAPVMEGDPQRLQQVVWNLLSNAVKFTDVGGRVDVELVDGDGQSLRIRVSDDGPGIHPAFLPHVFERFRQADGSVSREHGGLGLGLAIVRHLTELHGGTVSAQSEGLGKGSTFSVEFPRADPARALASSDVRLDDAARGEFQRNQPFSLHRCRVLVVDDDADAREMITTVLAAAGASVQTASSVQEALSQLETSTPDVLLADVGMPGADGYALIQEIRRREATNGGHLPAAAITAYAGPIDRDRALALGFDRHVSKPISPDTIIRTVRTMSRATDEAP